MVCAGWIFFTAAAWGCVLAFRDWYRNIPVLEPFLMELWGLGPGSFIFKLFLEKVFSCLPSCSFSLLNFFHSSYISFLCTAFLCATHLLFCLFLFISSSYLNHYNPSLFPRSSFPETLRLSVYWSVILHFVLFYFVDLKGKLSCAGDLSSRKALQCFPLQSTGQMKWYEHVLQ